MPLDQPAGNRPPPASPPPSPSAFDREMHIGDHLEELRYRLILALLGPILATGVTLYFGKELVAWLVKPGLAVLVALDQPPYFLALGATTGFAVYLKVSLVAGVVLTFPWIAYQFWKFIESGLHAHERRAIVIIAPFSAVMSAAGIAFLYYLLLPICLAFLMFFTATMPAPDLTPPAKDSLMARLTGITIRASGLDQASQKSNVGQSSPSPSRVQPPRPDGGHPPQNPKSNAQSPNSRISPPGPPPSALGDSPAPLAVLTHDPDPPVPGTFWLNAGDGEIHAAVGGRIVRFSPIGGGPMLRPNLDINQYISFVTLLAIGVVIAFQLPVVMLMLGWSNTVDPAWLKRYRKYCVFGCFVIGAVCTPVDPVSMMVLALPLWGLFELGLALMRLAYTPMPEEL